MQDVPLAKPRSTRRPSQLALASRWARTLGRVLFGVAAPLVCFGVLLAAMPELWLWPMALFVVTCVAAYVASWLRAPRADAVDSALHGAMVAATAFGGLWGIGIGGLTVLGGTPLLRGESPGAEYAILLVLGAAAPCGFVAYMRGLRQRWPENKSWRASSLAQTCALLGGCFGPGAACVALFVLLGHSATAVEHGVLSRSDAGDFASLRVWRWIAPEHSWGRIVDAWTTSTPQERARLDAAHEALTGHHIDRYLDD